MYSSDLLHSIKLATLGASVRHSIFLGADVKLVYVVLGTSTCTIVVIENFQLGLGPFDIDGSPSRYTFIQVT